MQNYCDKQVIGLLHPLVVADDVYWISPLQSVKQHVFATEGLNITYNYKISAHCSLFMSAVSINYCFKNITVSVLSVSTVQSSVSIASKSD